MMADANRADPFAGDLDLSDFKPGEVKKPKAEAAVIREVSEANNFPSRAAAKPAGSRKLLPCSADGARGATSSSISRRLRKPSRVSRRLPTRMAGSLARRSTARWTRLNAFHR